MTKDNLGQLYADMFGPNQGLQRPEVDTLTSRGMTPSHEWRNVDPVFYQHWWESYGMERERLPLLGDEQKEINQ